MNAYIVGGLLIVTLLGCGLWFALDFARKG
jgi:hypothetical protein